MGYSDQPHSRPYPECAIQTVFNERENFLVIGLTGKIGSGCSSTCEILQKEVDQLGFDCLAPKHGQKDYQFKNKQRQDRIIQNFALAGHWKPFNVIKVRDIITSFGLEQFGRFLAIIQQLSNEDYHFMESLKDKIKNKYQKYASEQLNHTDYDFFRQYYEFDDIIKLNKDTWDILTSSHHTALPDKIKYHHFFYLTTVMPVVSNIIRDILIQHNSFLYTRVYQNVGNIIRTYGELPKTKNKKKMFVTDAMYSIAKRINYLIKVYRYSNNFKEPNNTETEIAIHPPSPVRIVIDSIKNLFEAIYLRDRYSAFYLIAVSADENKRRSYLYNKGFDVDKRKDEFESIELCERPSKTKNKYKQYKNDQKNNSIAKTIPAFFEEIGNVKDGKYYNQIWADAYQNNSYSFNLQDVEACIQNADIFINNSKTKQDLMQTVVRYICLMMHPGLVTPTDDERCMQIAQTAKLNSGCISRQVGAVVCDKNHHILSIGWNMPSAIAPTEIIPCIYRSYIDLLSSDDSFAYSKFELNNPDYRLFLKSKIKWDYEKLDGLPATFCFKDLYCRYTDNKNQVHTRAQHGEEIALESCNMGQTEGGTLYTTSCSCELCAKKALHYGIRRIVYVEPYPGITEDHVLCFESIELQEANEQIKVELFTGACHRAYIQLYTPVLPLKDELALRGVMVYSKSTDNKKVENNDQTHHSTPHNGAH